METTETLNKLVHTILADAEAEAKILLAEAESESARVIKEAQDEAERRRQRILLEANAEAELVKKRELSRTGLKIRMDILTAKEKLIDQAFTKALEKLQAITQTPEYVTLLENLIVEGAIGLGGGELHVQTNHNDALQTQNFQKLEKRIIEQTKTNTTLILLPNRINCVGGAIVKTPDGSIVIDNTFEEKLARQRRELRILIAKTMFGS